MASTAGPRRTTRPRAPRSGRANGKERSSATGAPEIGAPVPCPLMSDVPEAPGHDRLLRGLGVMGDDDARTLLLRPFEHVLRRLELGRAGDAQLEIELRRRMDPARRHVVAIARPGDDLALDRPAMLLVGHHVGHELAR